MNLPGLSDYVNHTISSERSSVQVYDGSDRDWRLISLYELRKIESAINEECVGKTAQCPPGHLKEMHDSGNETIDKVWSRKIPLPPPASTGILQEHGTRMFWLSENQLYCLSHGWTHTSLTDKKNILQTIPNQMLEPVMPREVR